MLDPEDFGYLIHRLEKGDISGLPQIYDEVLSAARNGQVSASTVVTLLEHMSRPKVRSKTEDQLALLRQLEVTGFSSQPDSFRKKVYDWHDRLMTREPLNEMENEFQRKDPDDVLDTLKKLKKRY